MDEASNGCACKTISRISMTHYSQHSPSNAQLAALMQGIKLRNLNYMFESRSRGIYETIHMEGFVQDTEIFDF